MKAMRGQPGRQSHSRSNRPIVRGCLQRLLARHGQCLQNHLPPGELAQNIQRQQRMPQVIQHTQEPDEVELLAAAPASSYTEPWRNSTAVLQPVLRALPSAPARDNGDRYRAP